MLYAVTLASGKAGTKVIVEFDGPSHNNTKQREIDDLKDQMAKDAGFSVVRVPVRPASVIGVETISGL